MNDHVAPSAARPLQMPASAAHPDRWSNVVSIPSVGSQDVALSRVEHLLESIVDAITNGTELIIPYRSSRSVDNSQSEERPAEAVKFPGRTIQEAKKFGRRCCIELDIACLSGSLTHDLCLSQQLYFASLNYPMKHSSPEMSSQKGKCKPPGYHTAGSLFPETSTTKTPTCLGRKAW